MSGAHSIWAAAAAEDTGAALVSAQKLRWVQESNEDILLKLNALIGSMLEGIADAQDLAAAKARQQNLLDARRQLCCYIYI